MAAKGQVWAVNETGKYSSPSEVMMEEIRWTARQKMVFNQLVAHARDFGKKKGEKAVFTLWDYINQARTDLNVLSEDKPVPVEQIELRQIEALVQEFGLSVPYTERVETLSKQGMKAQIVKALRRNYQETVDKNIYWQMVLCPAQYVATGANAATLYTEGRDAVALDAASNLNGYHVKRIRDFMFLNNAIPDGRNNYTSVATTHSVRGIKNHMESVNMYTEQGIKKLWRGEIGRYENVRFIENNHVMHQDMGTGSCTGEAFFLGKDMVMRGHVMPMELRYKPGEDFNRNPAVAWISYEVYKLIHEVAKTGNFRQYRMVRFTSADVATS